jgi:transcriptional regulator with PAS, ATPase and Fis domain
LYGIESLKRLPVGIPGDFNRGSVKKPIIPQITNLTDLPVNLQQFIDEIPVGVFVVDSNRRIVLLNRTLEVLTGFSREESKGIPCCHILRSRLCIKHCPILQKKKPIRTGSAGDRYHQPGSQTGSDLCESFPFIEHRWETGRLSGNGGGSARHP